MFENIKMETIIIAAVSENDVIGFRGKIPWKIPEDIKRFKDKTIGHAVLMGRKTYDSIDEKFRPLLKRENIVLSRNPDYEEEGVMIYSNLDDAIEEARKRRVEKLFIAGGEGVYRDVMEKADVIDLTKVHMEIEGDVHFPRIDCDAWRKVESSDIYHSQSGLRYSIYRYERR